MDNETRFEELDKKAKDLEEKVKKLEAILYGISDDIRVKEYVRSNIVIGEHVAGKPTIVDKNGKKYNLQTV